MDMKSAINKKTVFLTGAAGLLGSHVTRELLLRNYSVVAFVENGKEPETLSGLVDVKLVYGNILNRDEVLSASKNCDVIIHAAASTAVIPARSQTINSVNITGTQNIINASLSHSVQKLIYVGSANTFGYGSLKDPGDETKPFCGDKFGLDYIDSKFEAHQRVMNAVKYNGLPAVIVCPTFMLGKYDSKPGSGAMVASVHSEKLPGYSAGGRNYVYVADVAVAIVNSIELGKIGESYILGNKNMDYKTAFNLIAKTIGSKAPAIKMPKFVVLSYGALCSFISSAFKRPMPVNFQMARIANEGFYYDCSKAVTELRMPQTQIETAINECYSWLKKQNLLTKK
jgi:dihydroflavonol-4-reductase